MKSLYDEYRQGHPDGYQSSAFGKYLQRYTLSTRAVGHVEHYAGDQMYIDYAGDKLEIVDAETCEIIPRGSGHQAYWPRGRKECYFTAFWQMMRGR